MDLPALTPNKHANNNHKSHKTSRGRGSAPWARPKSASGARTCLLRQKTRRQREEQRGMCPSKT
eukprot:3260845-Alexandrium_andersonii.AAC.1